MLVGNAITGNGTVPAGGAAGAVLGKNSTTDYDLGWTTPAGGGNVSTSGTITTGQYARWASGTTIESVAAATVKSDLVLTKGDVGLSAVTNDVQTKAAIVPNTIPSAGQLMVGNAGGTAFAAVTLTGASLSAAGALSSIANASLANSSITIAGTAVSLGGSILLNTIMGVTVSTVGLNFLDLVNPGAITFPKITAVNDVVAESAATYRTSLGATTVGNNVFTINTPGVTGFLKIATISGATTVEDPPTMRTTLGLVIGTNVQAWDTDLDTWATITPATGVGTFLITPSSANLRAALTDENGTGAALFSGATQPDFTTGFTIGGAGTANKMMKGDGTRYAPSTETFDAPGAVNNIMVSDGVNWKSKPDILTGAVTAQLVPAAAESYLTALGITFPAGSLTAGTTYKGKIYITKTAAGTAGMIINIRIGTLGTNSDALIFNGTMAAGTAVADTGTIEWVWILRTTGASATSEIQLTLMHNATTTGLWNTGAIPITVGSPTACTTFNSATPTKIGITITGGTSFAGTIDVASSELNIA